MPKRRAPLILLLTALLPFLATCLPPNSDVNDATAKRQLMAEAEAGARLSTRAPNQTMYGDIDISAFPSCAAASCIKSEQFSPSRIGCNSAKLTTDCLCHKAPTPLACSPEGPSDENNCWYQLEDWFSGACDGNVTMVDPATIPQCAQKCTFVTLSSLGCRSPTRNCLCILGRQPVIDAVGSCVAQNCAKKMQGSFSSASWRDDICKTGQAGAYDQDAYDKYIKMVHDTRIAVPVVVVLIAAFLLAGVYNLVMHDDMSGNLALGLIILIVVLALAIILPIEFAL
ncbi:hypothetical protein B0T24DRAFT_620450 [Lasiosphaeria ovina]|uniref:CFEM domain-containing protein n=1 Tax=Lasiosphaeria ovina TaxID=92902 RepID=A0AAE0KIZ4_9PEZI|nr:hypothetical protein B0T24DRAFT_620450 [Lasiosphaeria ovina]